MGRGTNQVILVGCLGCDPELKQTQAGVAFCRLSVATHDQKLAANGVDRLEVTEWHRVVIWGDEASRQVSSLRRGERVYVEGKLRTNTWMDGEGRRRQATQIHARTVFSLSCRRDGDETTAQLRDLGAWRRVGVSPATSGDARQPNTSRRPIARKLV